MGKKRREIPDLGFPLIETHCHLDYLKEDPLDAILDAASSRGVERFVTIAVEPANFDAVRRLADTDARIWGTQGVHPHEASSFDAAAAETIRASADNPRIVAVGEIGLDYHYDHSPRDTQRAVFAEQLAIASETDRPVVIHTREADDDTRAILAEFAPGLARRGVIHSFTSSPELAEFCLDQGFMLGFNGIVTFRAAENVREVVQLAPLEQLVIETDSPFLTPVPYRGRENAPCFIPFVAEKIAEVKGVDLEALLPILYRNSLALFWPHELEADCSAADVSDAFA